MNPEGIHPMNRAEDKGGKEPRDLEKEPLLPIPELQSEEMEQYVHEHGAEVGFEGAKERVIEVIKIVQEDEKALKLINETLESVFRYVEAVYNLELNAKLLARRWEGREYAEKVERHDGRRRKAHDSLIASLIATTRYLNANFSGQVAETGIYTGDSLHLVEQNRLAIADWAIELEHEILLGRAK